MPLYSEYTARFSKLEKFYILALSLIAILLLISHLLVQSYLNIQLNDSKTINLTGRQRMLSQKISKLALQLKSENVNSQQLKYELLIYANEWHKKHQQLSSHKWFSFFDSKSKLKIDSMYAALQPSVDTAYHLAINIAKGKSTNPRNDTDRLVMAGNEFLTMMDSIVFEYEDIARRKVTNLKQVDNILLIFAYLILICEFFLIFKPVTANLKIVVASLVDSEQKTKRLLEEKERLLHTLENTHNKYINLMEDQFKRELEHQKLNSLLVIQGQETERQRIAMDLHDGIGQWLTALKFNLEAIALNKQDAAELIQNCKQILAETIRQIRIISFNITPNELVDYGLAIAIDTLAQKMSRLTNKSITFAELEMSVPRFDLVIETNIFRIVQEAVNNAIKHADGTKIDIRLKYDHQILVLTVKDNGGGIKNEEIQHQEVLNGIRYMKERTALLNGAVNISSAEGKGTLVEITLPIKEWTA